MLGVHYVVVERGWVMVYNDPDGERLFAARLHCGPDECLARIDAAFFVERCRRAAMPELGPEFVRLPRHLRGWMLDLDARIALIAARREDRHFIESPGPARRWRGWTVRWVDSLSAIERYLRAGAAT